MNETLLSLEKYFDYFDISESDCPVRVSCVLPSAEALRRWPAYPAAARPEAGRLANGRGLSLRECRTSGLGEAIELASCCAWGDEITVEARLADLGHAALQPQAVTGYHKMAPAIRRAWNLRYSCYDWRPPVYDPERRIQWVLAKSALEGREVFVPADFVYIGLRNPGDEGAVAIADSNGCASGCDETSAKLSALLELVERDATGRWWYGCRHRCRFPIDILEDWPDLRNFLRERTRRTSLLDLTSDLEIPCVAALSWAPDGTAVAMGFCADLDVARASCSAITELIQMEFAIATALHEGIEKFPLLCDWLAKVSSATPIIASSAEAEIPARRQVSDAEEMLCACLEACEGIGCPLLFLNLTRPEFRVPTIRAISPALCHFKPRMGRERLFAPDTRDISQSRRAPPEGDIVPLLI